MLDDLRRQAEAALGDITDEEWELAIDSGWATGHLEYVDAVAHVCERLVTARAVFGRPTPGEVVDVGVPKDHHQRDQVLAYALAAEAAGTDVVLALRRDLLDGRLIEPEAVPNWVSQHVGDRPGVTGPVALSYLNIPNGTTEVAWVPERSVFGELAAWTRIQAHQRGWTPAHATMFMLSGTVPPITSFHATTYSHRRLGAKITLEIDPAITPAQLTRLYRQVRHRVLTGTRPRALDPKTLDLVLFVAAADLARHPEEVPPTWAERLAAWNQAHGDRPDYQYPEAATKQFARDARRAKDLLLHPPYLGDPNG